MGSIIYTLVNSPRDFTRIKIRVESQIFKSLTWSTLWLLLIFKSSTWSFDLNFYNNVLQGVLMSKPDNSDGSRGQLTAGTDICHLDEVYPRQCPCRRAFDLGSVFGTWRTRQWSDESKGTWGFTQVQPPRKVKGLRPACLTLYWRCGCDDGVTMAA
jgi:hypothetical protein